MLEKINKPEDVKKLSFNELIVLAQEVRERIIEVTSINGGHVAPSLGATDFIIALLKVFNLKTDNIVFDVGHQSYAYKILTGRNDRFDTLRTMGGISGFNNSAESEYDSFTVGHASTSISVTLGINIARLHQGKHGTSIAVIGDGALTGGMAFEALNHAGHLGQNMVVILNDNNMSISKNVGALQNYLTNVLISKSYNVFKKQVWDLVHTLPTSIRSKFVTGAQKMEGSLMNIIVPNIFFEDMGFKYVGPVDGHDIPRMCRVFNQVLNNISGPVLIHLITTKGKGLPYAENDSSKFHGIGPFDHETGVTNGNNDASWSTVFGKKLVDLAEIYKDIVVITAAMTDGTGLSEFAKRYPDRLYDVGIAEQHAVTLAAGMASKGLKPFVAIYSSFLQRSVDQIIHDVALQKLPVVLCIDRSGLVGEDGATHQGVYDLSYLQFIPNITIISPACESDLKSALEWAALNIDTPVAIRYPRGVAISFINHKSHFEYMKADVWAKGRDIAITGVGQSFTTAAKVYDMLKEDNPTISAYLINPLFIKPYDKALYDEIYNTCQYHFVIEENAQIGGFASRLCLDYSMSDCRTVSYAIPDVFVEHGKIEQLRGLVGIETGKVFNEIKSVLERKSK